MSDLSIRSATVDDVAVVCEVATASWHDTYDETLGPDTVDTILDDWYDPDSLAAQIAEDADLFILATIDSTVVGFGNAGPDPEQADVHQLWRLYVTPDHQGEGVGSQLLGAIESELSKDRDVLELTVLATNDRARGFYESRGFELFDRKPTMLVDTSVVECVYRKPLRRRQG